LSTRLSIPFGIIISRLAMQNLLSDYVETLILKKLNTAGLKPVGASSTIKRPVITI
jgi:hypothetical protein